MTKNKNAILRTITELIGGSTRDINSTEVEFMLPNESLKTYTAEA